MSLFWNKEVEEVQTTYQMSLLFRLIPVFMLVLMVLVFTPIDMDKSILGLLFILLLIFQRILLTIIFWKSKKITEDGKWYRFSEPYKIVVGHRTK